MFLVRLHPGFVWSSQLLPEPWGRRHPAGLVSRSCASQTALVGKVSVAVRPGVWPFLWVPSRLCFLTTSDFDDCVSFGEKPSGLLM